MQISYTKSAQHALKYASRAAREMKHPYIGTEHLLLALREEYTGVAGQVLANSGVESEKILKLMDELITPAEEHPAAKGKTFLLFLAFFQDLRQFQIRYVFH